MQPIKEIKALGLIVAWLPLLSKICVWMNNNLDPGESRNKHNLLVMYCTVYFAIVENKYIECVPFMLIKIDS